MSVFSGPGATGQKVGKNKGVMRKHRDKRYNEAVARQQANIDRGYYLARPVGGFGPDVQRTPAPITEFQRKGDRS